MTLLWWHWIVFGVVLLVAEIVFVNSYSILWFGLGALVVGALLALAPGFALWAQVLLWAALSAAALAAWIFYFRPHFDRRRRAEARRELVGAAGIVVRSAGGQGDVRFQKPYGGRDVWPFKTAQAFKVGERAVVAEVAANGELKLERSS